MYKKIFLLSLVILLFSTESIFGASAKALNAKGFELYKQGNYEKALDLFRESCEADDSYPYAHYNFACTASMLLSKDVCGYMEYLDDIFSHLEKTVQLKPEYKQKMRKDADLKFLRQYYRFYVIAGYDVNVEKDLFEIVTSISWYGPKPGVYPPSPCFQFNKDHSVRIGLVNAEGAYTYYTGHFTLQDKTIQIQLDKKIDAVDAITATFKDGHITFEDGDFSSLTDNAGLCDA